MRPIHLLAALRPALLTLALLAPGWRPAAAQVPAQPPPQLPATVTEAQVLDRLRQSGMTREQARARLTQLGYDPALAEPFFDRLEGRSAQAVAVDDQFSTALRAMGLLDPQQAETEPQVFTAQAPPGGGAASRIFGRSVFAGSTSQFQPVLMGPVDAGYRLGPGDELLLVLTGDVELAHTLPVTREGFVVIPDVGQVFVNGLTLEGLRNQLYDRLGQVYSGVRRTRPTTFFDVTVGRLRTNQVFVVGDAVRPGAYQVSSVSTVFNALHQAGGPSDLGSFRNVEVRRGGQLVARVDLYDYLLAGDASRDIRLDQGDLVVIPAAGPQVAVEGQVRRPAIYELQAGEGLRDALQFAGGFSADAYVQRVQIDRVLPPQERTPGADRAIMDVDVVSLSDPSGPNPPLRDGDEVTVFATLAERRNRITVSGSVFRPGLYEYRPGMTVWELIQRADGLSGEAFRPVAHVLRPLVTTGGAELLRVSLEPNAQGRPAEDLVLADGDQVVIYSNSALLTRSTVAIEGWVKEPGAFPFASGMTVRDLILAADGFREGADVFEAEVVRLRIAADRSDTIAMSQALALDGSVPAAWVPAARATNGNGSAPARPAADLELAAGDRVFIRRMPGYVTAKSVTVDGQVLHAGPYALELREERLSSVLRRAGGPTEDANVGAARLMRGGQQVGIDLEEALDNPGGRDDLILENGDVIVVPALEHTVRVEGAVVFASLVAYRSGQGVKGYLEQAGGALENADLDRITVQYPSGRRATVSQFLGINDYPGVEPGSTIFVPPQVDDSGIDWGEVFQRSFQAATALITILLAVDRLDN
jgi:protein involved in polysaccharide export with SLBB domain